MPFLRKLAIVIGFAILSIAAAPVAAYAGPVEDEAAFVNHLNTLRLSRGLHVLGVNPQLTDMARGWSGHMAQRGAISHNPNMAAQAPRTWTKLGENVGVGGSEPAIHQALVNSPGHFANLVDPKFTEVGVGVVHANGRIYVTQNFMASTSKPAPAAPTRAAVAPQSTPFNQRYAKVKADNPVLVDNARSIKANIALGR